MALVATPHHHDDDDHKPSYLCSTSSSRFHRQEEKEEEDYYYDHYLPALGRQEKPISRNNINTGKDQSSTKKSSSTTLELMNVFLRMWDGKTLCCTIDPSCSNTTNLQILESHVLSTYPNYNNNEFYFVLGGKPLTTTTTTMTSSTTTGNNKNKKIATHKHYLCNNNVNNVIHWREGCTVFVQYRNKGGCFIISFTILCIIMTALVGSTCTCGASLLVVPVLLPFLFILPLFCL